jgi:hypothetical protein
MKFSALTLKKAIKVAQDMGLAVSGYEISPAGEIRVLTGAEAKNEADAALERWKKSRG